MRSHRPSGESSADNNQEIPLGEVQLLSMSVPRGFRPSRGDFSSSPAEADATNAIDPLDRWDRWQLSGSPLPARSLRIRFDDCRERPRKVTVVILLFYCYTIVRLLDGRWEKFELEEEGMYLVLVSYCTRR